jgi:hypothetical protein
MKKNCFSTRLCEIPIIIKLSTLIDGRPIRTRAHASIDRLIHFPNALPKYVCYAVLEYSRVIKPIIDASTLRSLLKGEKHFSALDNHVLVVGNFCIDSAQDAAAALITHR